MKNFFLKAFVGIMIFTTFSFAVAGYAYRRASIANPELMASIAKHYNVRISSTNNGFSFTNDSENGGSSEKNYKNVDLKVTQSELDIATKSTDVSLEKSPDEKLHISAEGYLEGSTPADQLFNIEFKDDKVRISQGDNPMRDVTLHIQIPAGIHSLFVAAMSGDVNAKDLHLEAMKVVTMSGDIHLQAMALADLEAKSASGDIEVLSHSLNKIEIKSVSGSVTLHSPDLDKSAIDLHTVSGDVINPFPSITKSPKKVDVSTVSGDINLSVAE
jgi:DUF4097 and DUF4098 domain-containing protein YvlB